LHKGDNNLTANEWPNKDKQTCRRRRGWYKYQAIYNCSCRKTAPSERILQKTNIYWRQILENLNLYKY